MSLPKHRDALNKLTLYTLNERMNEYHKDDIECDKQYLALKQRRESSKEKRKHTGILINSQNEFFPKGEK